MKRIGRFFLRLGLRARLMLVIGILAFVLTAGSIAAFSYAIEFTEDHLVSENQYYSLRGYIDSDIAHGKAPRLLPNKKLYADPSVVNGVKLEPIPPEFQNLPDGYTEYEDDHQADYVFRMQRHGVTYILTTDQTEFEEVEHSLVAVVVLFGLLAVMAAVLMAWLLGGTVVRPVKKLAREVQRCASEKEFRPLSVELTNDEVGYLAKTCENSLRKLHETVQSERFFASDLSHEFRTHLSIVSTTAELMREIGDLTPQQERQLAKITLAAERMQRLIHVLLALARDKDVKAADNDIKYLPDIAREIQEEDGGECMGDSKKYIVWIQEKSAVVVFLFLFLISALRYKQFFTPINLINLFRQSSIIGVIAVGMTFVIITGCIDLSVGAIVAVCGILAARMCTVNIVAAILVPLCVGALIGIINGTFVTKLEVPPWITSLSMMMCLRGIAYIMTNESSVNVEKVSPAFQMIGRGKILGLPVPGILFLLFVVIGTYGLKYTRFGRSVYATGGNREGARMMGIRIDKTIILSYMLCGIGAAMSGLILASRLGAAQSTAGELYEMQVIAAVVLGGTLLTGGVGHMPGTLFGVFTMSMITNIFNMQGNISTWWQNVIMGFMILAIVIMQSGLEQIKMKKSEEEAIC